MTEVEIEELFVALGADNRTGEYRHHERISPERRLSRRPDLNAFLLLDRLVVGRDSIVDQAWDDAISLSVTVADLARSEVTAADIRDLVRCGVRANGGRLGMNV